MSGISLNLEKGVSLNLSKEFGSLKRINLGLGWKTHMDLDAFAILLDSDGKYIDTVSYRNESSHGISLSGDDRVGGKKGDCETIFIDLNSISNNVKKICLYTNIFNAGSNKFSSVENSYLRLINPDNKEELAIYRLNDQAKEFNAIHYADLTITDDGIMFEIVAKGLDGTLDSINRMYKSNGKSKISEQIKENSNDNTSEENRGFFGRLFGR